jgi:hypothetical protein
MRGDLIETIVGIGIALVICILAAPYFAVKGIVWLAKNMAGTNKVPTVAPLVDQPTGKLVPATVNPDRQASLGVGPSKDHMLRTLADFHVCVQFSDSFTASVSVHKAEKVARRKLRAVSTAAGALMRTLYLRESFDLPDVKLENGVTYEDAILDTETVGMRFIEDLISKKSPQYFRCAPPSVVVGAGSNDLFKPALVVDPETTARSLAILRGDIAVAEGIRNDAVAKEAAPAMQASDAQVQQKIKRTARAFTVGRVIEFGMRKMMFNTNAQGKAGNPGTTFEAMIECENAECVSLRGVRLEELFKEHQVSTGDHVEIISLGRTRVTIGNETKARNEFELKVLQRA